MKFKKIISILLLFVVCIWTVSAADVITTTAGNYQTDVWNKYVSDYNKIRSAWVSQQESYLTTAKGIVDRYQSQMAKLDTTTNAGKIAFWDLYLNESNDLRALFKNSNPDGPATLKVIEQKYLDQSGKVDHFQRHVDEINTLRNYYLIT